MGMKRKPIRTKLHKADTVLSNSDKKDMLSNGKKEQTRTEKRQEAIDTYNFYGIREVSPIFESSQLTGRTIAVRMHKENYIKFVELMDGNVPMYDAFISQIDGRMNKTQKEKWVDNPLPYVFSGEVVAISPLVKADYLKQRNEILDVSLDLAEEFVAPKVGDIVTMKHFDFISARFYANKQERDFIKNPEENRIIHFDGYVLLSPVQIESVITDKDYFYSTLSPYKIYSAWKKHMAIIGESEIMKARTGASVTKNVVKEDDAEDTVSFEEVVEFRADSGQVDNVDFDALLDDPLAQDID